MYIADLHIHSRYSRATSRDCTPEQLDLWASRKGIGLVGTGDFTHPAWREELAEKLEPAGDGTYVLKEEYRIKDQTAGNVPPRFVMTGEISSIYKKEGRVRKVHSLILLPGLEEAAKLSRKLEQIGNIHSDGRPILGLDCHDLLEITLELCRTPSMCRPISGPLIFRCSALFPVLIRWKSVMVICLPSSMRWKRGSPPIPP